MSAPRLHHLMLVDALGIAISNELEANAVLEKRLEPAAAEVERLR